MSTDNLMRLQVEQLAKEKKELAERMRIASKRLDHIERAYRKEERPLLAKDYDIQQESDKATFDATQKARLEAHRLAYQRDMETKKRLARAMSDYLVKKEEIMSKRKEEFQRRQDLSQKKIEEEKAKRKAAVLKQREEERLRLEEEERIQREREEEERQLEAGKSGPYNVHLQSFDLVASERIAEEERRAAEEEAELARIEAKKREEEEARAEAVRKREEERAALAAQARLQQQREEEALERARARAAERTKPTAAPAPIPVRATPSTDTWRRSGTVPAARAASPPRSESPAAAAVPKYRPGALSGGGWRSREAAKKEEAPGTTTPRAASPAPRPPPAPVPAKAEPVKEEEGFQTVEKKGVWRPRRGRF